MRSGSVLRAFVIAAGVTIAGMPLVGAADDVAPAGDPMAAGLSRAVTLAPDQLADLVAPLALYPDGLLSQVLVASTYPLEVVQAQQWVRRNGRLKGQELTEAARQQRWDASVQALVAFPDVLARLNEDVEWTTDLGNAFLAQEADVLAAVQRMRSRARASGKLSSTREQTVTTVEQEGAEAIEITPADEQVVYVPEYDPADIWGEPLASAYPPLDYVPGYAFGPAVDVGFWFGPWAGWGWGWAWGWGWGPSWHGGSVYCNGAFFRHHGYRGYRGHEGNDGHGGHGGPPGHGPSGHLAWSHDPGHRMGVPYPNGRLAGRYQAVSMASRATGVTPRSWNRGSPGGAAPNPFRTTSGSRGAVADRPGRTTAEAWREGRGAFPGQARTRYQTPSPGSTSFRSEVPRQQPAPRQFAQGGSRAYSSVPRPGGGSTAYGGGSPRPTSGGHGSGGGAPSYGGSSHPSGGGHSGGGSHGARR